MNLVRNCKKSMKETPEQCVKSVQICQWRRSDVFIVYFEQISHIVLVFLLLTFNKQMPAGKANANNTLKFMYSYFIFKSMISKWAYT